MTRRTWWLVALLALAALALAGCGGDDDDGEAGGTTAGETTAGPKSEVTLQLKWVTQSQFAGYYAALEEGYYDDAGLDVTIKPGGPDITPEQVVASGAADFGINWMPSLLATRDKGSDLVNIAQVFARSAMLELTWKDSGITSFGQMKGKKVGVWCCGNEFELLAALRKNGIEPSDKSDVTMVNQPFDMNLFMQRQVDAAAAMTYNELAQVLAAKNPETNEQVTREDINILSMEDAGTAMLEDGIFVRGDWISDPQNRVVAQRFLEASYRGWMFCRDNAEECLQHVLSNGPTLGEEHQRWMLNEINALIWPNERGIGLIDEQDFQRTADIAHDLKVIKQPATKDAYRTDLAQAALDALKDEDVKGEDWQKEELEVQPAS
jgi:NitT/TauT family transport system substrate-binding protein